jgi:hypothetical protein
VRSQRDGVGSFTAPIVTRILLINAASFGVLLAAREFLTRGELWTANRILQRYAPCVTANRTAPRRVTPSRE